MGQAHQPVETGIGHPGLDCLDLLADGVLLSTPFPQHPVPFGPVGAYTLQTGVPGEVAGITLGNIGFRLPGAEPEPAPERVLGGPAPAQTRALGRLEIQHRTHA